MQKLPSPLIKPVCRTGPEARLQGCSRGFRVSLVQAISVISRLASSKVLSGLLDGRTLVRAVAGPFVVNAQTLTPILLLAHALVLFHAMNLLAQRQVLGKWTSREVGWLQERVANLASCAEFGPPESWGMAKWDVLRVQYRWNRSAADLRCRFLNAEAPGAARAKQNWSSAEDARLRAAVRNMDYASGWVGVAAEVGGQRGALACLRRARRLQRAEALRARGTKWTEKENEMVIKAVRVHGSHWRDVALLVGTRDNQSCMHHYRKRLKPGRRVGKWSNDEEKMLREAVAKEGMSWIRVAKHVPGRNDVQCREKWKNTMSPTIQMGPFSLGEKALVLVLAHLKKNKWADIARVMTWRTPKQCLRRCRDLRNSAVRGLLTRKRRFDATMNLGERRWKRIARDPNGRTDD